MVADIADNAVVLAVTPVAADAVRVAIVLAVIVVGV